MTRNADFENVPCNICDSRDTTPINCGFDPDRNAELFGRRKSTWVLCNKCSFLYQNPRPSEETWKKLYQESFYRELTGGVDTAGTREYSYKQFDKVRAWFEKVTGWNLNERKPKAFLDFGCGIGGTLKYFEDLGVSNTAGVEVDPHCIARGQAIFNVRIENSMENFVPEKEGVFDLVFTHHALEHMQDMNVFFSDLRPRLTNDGFLVIVLPSYWTAKTRYGYGTDVTHNYIVTHHTLKYFFEKHGFTMIDHRYSHKPGSDCEIWCVAKKGEKLKSSFSSGVVIDSIRELNIRIPFRIALYWLPERVILWVLNPLKVFLRKNFLPPPSSATSRIS